MIVKAAVKFHFNQEDVVIPCHRHSDAFLIVKLLRPELKLYCFENVQGFLDENDNFLTRQEAWLEAKRCNQILPIAECPGILYSEDLW